MIGHKVEQAVTVRALRGATPYIHMYKGKVFVIKAGGGAFRDAGTMRAFVEQVTILHHLGIRVVLVRHHRRQVAAAAEGGKPFERRTGLILGLGHGLFDVDLGVVEIERLVADLLGAGRRDLADVSVERVDQVLELF